MKKRKQQALSEHRAAKQKVYADKQKGQWSVCKDMGAKRASPLVAVRRPEKGPKGQRKLSVATQPAEIDSILRKAYGNIYAGNAANKDKLCKQIQGRYQYG